MSHDYFIIFFPILFPPLSSVLGASHLNGSSTWPRHGCSSLVATITRCGVLFFKTSRLQDWFVALHSRVFWHICKSEGPICLCYLSVSLSRNLVATAFFVSSKPICRTRQHFSRILGHTVLICHSAKKSWRTAGSNNGPLKQRILQSERSSTELASLGLFFFLPCSY